MVIFALIGLFAHGASLWTSGVVGILGILSFISPWVLGYSTLMSAFWANLILGAIAVIFAVIGLLVRRPAVAA
ncbi:MAG TPA: SPW repeat protein [Anaerolineae bacterium]